MTPPASRYAALAAELLAAPDPVTAIAHELGDHAGRLDALVARLDAVEARVRLGALARRLDAVEARLSHMVQRDET